MTDADTNIPKRQTDRDLIRRVWNGYIWPQHTRLFQAFFFMAVLAGATAAYSLIVKVIIDSAQGLSAATPPLENAKIYASTILPALLLVTFVSGGTNFIQTLLTNSIALNTVGALQKDMFRAAHGSDYRFFTQAPIGTLLSKFTNDVTVISSALLRVLNNLIKDVLTLIFALIVMLNLDWQLTVLVVILYPLAAWPIISISKRLRGNATEVQNHIGEMTSDLKESFGGARMVKTYGLEPVETKRLTRSFNERIRLYFKLVSEQARVDPILEVFGGLAIAGVVIFGVYQVSVGNSTPGDIAGVLTSLLVASPRIRALGTLNNVIQEGLAALTRIFEVIDEQPTIVDAPKAGVLSDPSGHLKVQDVHFTYPDGTRALNGLTLDAKPGESIALVGASGSGKSTLINLIPRLYDVASGHITIDGKDIRHVTLKSLRASLALVSQDIILFNDSVANNIGFGDTGAGRDEIIDAAKAADAHGFIMRLPQGYDTIIGEDGDTLSGGQKQRLSIARAILRDAPILLLDEATSALDAESETKVQAALEHLTNGRTTIIIAHRLSTVQRCDKIYVLDQGQVVENGTHKTLSKKKNGTYAKLRALQLS